MADLPPCAKIKVSICSTSCSDLEVVDSTLTYDLFSSPNQKTTIEWITPPKNVLLVGKFFDTDARSWMDKLAK